MTRDGKSTPQSAAAAHGPDPAKILASIGIVAYDWRIDSDTLVWGGNVADVLPIRDLGRITTGRGYASLLDADNTVTRYDAVMNGSGHDSGNGFPYQAEYSLRTEVNGGTRLWVEDNGRWFAGPDGRPARAHGVVRVVNERHDHQERLAYLSRFDDLTGEMNRNALTQALTKALDDATRFRTSCGFMLLSVDNLSRINEAYGFGVADEVIAAVGRRIRSRMRADDLLGRFSGNKFGVVLANCTPEDLSIAADRFLAAVREDVVQTAARTGGRDGDHRRRVGAASCAHGRGNHHPRAGIARFRQGEAARLVRGVPAEHRARSHPQGKRARDRQDRDRAERTPHSTGVRAAGRHRLAPARLL